jgi:hypothetical protein
MSSDAGTDSWRSGRFWPRNLGKSFRYDGPLFGIEPTQLVDYRVTEATSHVEDDWAWKP